jgi:hypothetical protein
MEKEAKVNIESILSSVEGFNAEIAVNGSGSGLSKDKAQT